MRQSRMVEIIKNTKGGSELMCEYCEKEKRIEENENDNIYFKVWGKHLQVIGKVLNIPLGRDVIINYCPMYRKKVRR